MTFQPLASRRISSKLLLICLSFLLPIAVLLYFTIAGINKEIRFAEQELGGNAYQRPLHELLRHLSRYQWLCNVPKVTESDLAAERGRIDQAFQRLDAIQQLLGNSLQVSENGLAKRQRSHSLPSEMVAAWRKFENDFDSLSSPIRDARTRQLRDNVRQLVSHVGDTSNLILDPDLDSYYLMDV